MSSYTKTLLKPWKILSREDVSPSPHLPVEKRVYELPDGSIVDDFYIATIPDSVHIIPVTKQGRVIMIKMFKQGVDDMIIQFPAGRFEPEKHKTLERAAVAELAEETGIEVVESDLQKLGAFPIMSTKGTEKFHSYLVKDVVLSDTSKQDLDPNEEIEILEVTPTQINEMILSGEICDALAITNWAVAQLHFPQLFVR